MKTAISIPDALYRAAERVAKRKGLSRSELYAQAVAAFVAREDDDAVTAALDAVYGRADDGRLDDGLRAVPARVLGDEPW
jgi:predicted transcriptional regulator